MRRSYFLTSILAVAVLALSAIVTSAQTGQLRGSVQLAGADGKQAPVTGALIDVFRTDMTGDFHTKTDKKGEWVFAGLPYVGKYVVSVSAPGAAPFARSGVLAGRDIPVDIVLQPGDGKRLSQADAISLSKGGGATEGPAASSGSATDKAKLDELKKKNDEILAANKKAEDTNKIVGESFKAGNVALSAKNYEEAIKQYDIGLAADPIEITSMAMAPCDRRVAKSSA